MSWKIFSLLVLSFVFLQTGCGGLSQDDLRSHAFSRDSDDEEESAPADSPEPVPSSDTSLPQATVPPATPSSAVATQPANTAVQSSIRAIATPSQTVTTTVSKPNVPQVGILNPLDEPFAAPVTALQPDSTNAPASEVAVAEEEEGPPNFGEDPSAEEIAIVQRWHLNRQRKAQESERKAEMEAAKKQAATVATKGAADDAITAVTALSEEAATYNREYVRALLDRLGNPENLAPVELARVGQELSYGGNTKEALAYYYGWAVTIEDGSAWVKGAAWSPALQRPLAAIHWGLALEYSGAPQLLSNANPIGKESRSFVSNGRIKSNEKMNSYVGELGDRLVLGLDSRLETGRFGSLLKPPANPEQHERTVELRRQVRLVGFEPESMGSGVTLLGGGTRKELLHVARREGVDVLVVYDMNLKQPRPGMVINNTSLKLIDVAREKEMTSSSAFNNVKVQLARQDRSQKDLVEKEFEELFAYIDESLSLTEMPRNIREEQAQARIEQLANTKLDNPLPVLAEMRLYHALGLVGDATLYAGYKVLIGDGPAKQLITGTPAERVATISQYLPKLDPVRRN